MKKIKVLLIDDSEIYIEGIKAILFPNEFISVIGEVYTTESAKTFLKTNMPDVILLDISIEEDYDGIIFASYLHDKYPELPVIILSHYKEVRYITKALRSYVRAYIAKDTKPVELINIILSVMHGKGVFFGDTLPYDTLLKTFGGENNLQHGKPFELSRREVEIISKLADGFSSKEIASILNIDKNTIETYKDRIKVKLGVNTVVEMVVFALKNKII